MSKGIFPILKQINAQFALRTAKNAMRKAANNVHLVIICLREFVPFAIVHVRNVKAEDLQAAQAASLQPCFQTVIVDFVRVDVVVATLASHKVVILA